METEKFPWGAEEGFPEAVALDGAEEWDTLSDIDRYDLAAAKIAREAPVHMAPGELLPGAVTLNAAKRGIVPVTYGGELFMGTRETPDCDWEKILRVGFDGIKKEIGDEMAKNFEPDTIRGLISRLRVIDALRVWRERYLAVLGSASGCEDVYACLSRVPFTPASSYSEAAVGLAFTLAFFRLLGNDPDASKIPELIAPLLQVDLLLKRVSEAGAEDLSRELARKCSPKEA